MGIRYLTQHLLPHAQTVWLRNTKNHDQNVKTISSVVVDGPALVYHVYSRLLSWSGVDYNVVDAQPSANEVSIGVMQFLLCLRGLDVRIEKIFFDGALPLSKRPVRFERMEATRRKLRELCRDTAGGFKTPTIRRKALDICPEKIFGRRPLPRRFKPMPESAFVVPTVIEDLKHRWSPEEVLRCTAGVPELQKVIITACGNTENGNENDGSIFAEITEVVPGEADVYCAIAARDSGCAVLTGDSDLLVHDLGPEGSVIFLDSLETGEPLPNDALPVAGAEPDIASRISIRATQVRPAAVAKKLGVPSFPRLAYEVKRDPRASFATTIQRAKGNADVVEKSAKYISFLKEYDLGGHEAAATTSGSVWTSSNPLAVITDPKLSELYAQYELPSFAMPEEGAHVYLQVLIERHDRRAAWMEGSELRLLAYSLLNLGYPAGDKGKRKEAVIEHMRKGRRIAAIPLTLLAEKEAEERLEAFVQQVNTFVSSVDNDDGGDDESSACEPAVRWRAFALYDVLARMGPDERLATGKLRRFLERGYCGEKLEWDDIHLHAQMKAVLYSLRVLKEVLVAGEDTAKSGSVGERLVELMGEAGGVLRDLPWMRDCAQRTGGIGGGIENGEAARRVIEGLISLLDEGEGEMDVIEGSDVFGASACDQSGHGLLESSTAGAEEAWIVAANLPGSRKRKKGRSSSGGVEQGAPIVAKNAMNMYDILRQVD
ncbi:hypothetical protein BDBG_09176 [Blastomyces gilchristii SLH14081]|uniref:Asteroid domain-containing protein n=1 Tax=Blastomyces gilchristii (strain SLH14081) TaxID=559298 RepID=A0A179V169_BLAGS|nr:uncharacterized protein BDBG_09176 [Blastomyces gilchristii SLH14081]OAT14084.1 hypothetical protein BDBG_09176 [Blastomyces gilchristii SLH14081]